MLFLGPFPFSAPTSYGCIPGSVSSSPDSAITPGSFFSTFPHALITFPGAVTKYLAKATKEWGSLLCEGTVHHDKGDIEAGW